MAKKLDTIDYCSATVGFPPKQGTWDFLQLAHQEEVSAIIQGLIGPGYSATTAYVLWGVTTSGFGTVYFTEGAVYFNGEVFRVAAQHVLISGIVGEVLWGQIVANPYGLYGPNADPVQFTGTSAPPVAVHNDRMIVFQFGFPDPSTSIGSPGSFVYLNNLETLSTILTNETTSLASAFGSPTGTYLPVVVSGMTFSGIDILPGGFYYNGLYYTFPGFYPVFGGPTVIEFSLSTINGVPTASASYGSVVTPSATSFNYTSITFWNAQTALERTTGTVNGTTITFTQDQNIFITGGTISGANDITLNSANAREGCTVTLKILKSHIGDSIAFYIGSSETQTLLTGSLTVSSTTNGLGVIKITILNTAQAGGPGGAYYDIEAYNM